MNVKVGDEVLVPEYGGTKLTFDEKASHLQCCVRMRLRESDVPFVSPLPLQDYYLFRDMDVLGVFDS